MQAFHCKLVPPRARFVQDSSAAEAAAMKQHAAYRQARIDQGARVFALGRGPGSRGSIRYRHRGIVG